MSGKCLCHIIAANYIADAMMPHELMPGLVRTVCLTTPMHSSIAWRPFTCLNEPSSRHDKMIHIGHVILKGTKKLSAQE